MSILYWWRHRRSLLTLSSQSTLRSLVIGESECVTSLCSHCAVYCTAHVIHLYISSTNQIVSLCTYKGAVWVCPFLSMKVIWRIRNLRNFTLKVYWEDEGLHLTNFLKMINEPLHCDRKECTAPSHGGNSSPHPTPITHSYMRVTNKTRHQKKYLYNYRSKTYLVPRTNSQPLTTEPRGTTRGVVPAK